MKVRVVVRVKDGSGSRTVDYGVMHEDYLDRVYMQTNPDTETVEYWEVD